MTSKIRHDVNKFVITKQKVGTTLKKNKTVRNIILDYEVYTTFC